MTRIAGDCRDRRSRAAGEGARRIAEIESARALMAHPEIRVLLVTGGPGVVKAALSMPKKAICGGPGNPPVVVDESDEVARRRHGPARRDASR